jgi:hypothetical protein
MGAARETESSESTGQPAADRRSAQQRSPSGGFITWFVEHVCFAAALFWNVPTPQSDTREPMPDVGRVVAISVVWFLIGRAAAMYGRRERLIGAVVKTAIFTVFAWALQAAIRM